MIAGQVSRVENVLADSLFNSKSILLLWEVDMKILLKITTSILMAFFLMSGCSGGSHSPVSPEQKTDDNLPSAELGKSQSSEMLFGMWDVKIDPETLSYQMEPVNSRNALAIGDSFEVEIGKLLTGTFEGITCPDCLKIVNIGLHGNGDILLDMGLRHPFSAAYRMTKRGDLDVFDPRVILISSGTDARFTQTNGIGIANAPVMGNFNLLKNADGFTSHFDNRSEIPEFVGTPRNYTGNLNPFKYFFVDADTSPVIYGKENPEHRMRMGSQTDIQRLRLANPGAGNVLEFIMAFEVSYVQAATMKTRLTPVYHVPEGNQKEAYRVTTNLPRSLVEGSVTPLDFNVYVEDWQNSTPTGPLATQVRKQSDVKRVTVEIPGVSSVLGSQQYPTSGDGFMYYPYVFHFIMPLDLNPVVNGNPYLALIAVEDEYNDFIRADVYYNPEPLDDFVAYKIIPVNIMATGTLPVITIYNYTVDLALGSCVISGQIDNLDASSTVTLTHNGQPYPMSVDFDGSFTTTVILFIGPNNISIDATNSFGADSASIPLINYSPMPLPAFRVTLYWEPSTPDPLDSTDMDLHLWNSTDEHCFFDDKTINYAALTVDDPDGYGPENIDGRGSPIAGFYPIAVNYYSNHRGFLTHSIDCTVRALLNPGTVNEVTLTYNFTLTEENSNDPFSYPVLDTTTSWQRVVDIGIDPSGVATAYPPDIVHGLPY